MVKEQASPCIAPSQKHGGREGENTADLTAGSLPSPNPDEGEQGWSEGKQAERAVKSEEQTRGRCCVGTHRSKPGVA